MSSQLLSPLHCSSGPPVVQLACEHVLCSSLEHPTAFCAERNWNAGDRLSLERAPESAMADFSGLAVFLLFFGFYLGGFG